MAKGDTDRQLTRRIAQMVDSAMASGAYSSRRHYYDEFAKMINGILANSPSNILPAILSIDDEGVVYVEQEHVPHPQPYSDEVKAMINAYYGRNIFDRS